MVLGKLVFQVVNFVQKGSGINKFNTLNAFLFFIIVIILATIVLFSITPSPTGFQMQSGEEHLVKPCDAGTQTDTHLVESNIVKSYEWNEWELRRKAIQMANLRKKVTRSAQTNLSHMRRDNATQTYLPKDAACQTKKDSSSNVPNPLIYLAGLRGKPGPTKMIRIDLTRPVDE
ncbi:cilia- and flagella-associated protein 206-like [Denticeps clupeoides]|uniref:cilia- and flagella-associated protein 206-like n=1 Tax=Denticeps clupeoides TaxID=299321 RepID=UPI0010A481C7|nr:cilia- and flagella-associated protein 206-like [Denticeps clupeoides]